ncbi:MAG TPA: HAMP domain-containing protein, partial [Magnetococcales bacterium]|nr:HAMP domain-containing protein [Magnetococcales bacterium]
MTWSSIRFQTYTALLLIALAAIAAGGTMVLMIERVKEDTDVVIALDRQRMLTQTMAKAAMGYVLAKSGSQSLEQQVRILDAYMAHIEQTLVEQHNQPPQPSPVCPTQAVLRQTNKTFAAALDIPITLMGRHPLNPDNHLQDAIDRQALDWLRTHPGQIFSTSIKSTHGLKLRFYTATPLYNEHCRRCHQKTSESTPQDQENIGIRRFGFHFSGDIALGKAELEPSLIEYYFSRDLFKTTLMALRFGGDLPLDRTGRATKTIDPLNVPAVKTRLEAMNDLFTQFTESAQSLFKAPLGSEAYRQARQAISEQSNRLRSISEDLVQRHTALLLKEQEQRILLVAAVVMVVVLVVILSAALFIRRSLLNPLATLHEAMESLAAGNLQATALLHHEKNEIGRMGQAFNLMANHLAQTIRQLRIHASSLTALTKELVKLEQVMDKNIRTGSALNRQAQGWMQRLEQSLPPPDHAHPDALTDLQTHVHRLGATMTEAMKLAAINYGVLDHARILTESITECSQSLHETDQAKISPPESLE